MTSGPIHYRQAEQLAAEAYKRLGQEDEQSAATWAVVAQVYATLADTAALVQLQLGMGYGLREEWQGAIGLTPEAAAVSRVRARRDEG